MRVAAVMFTALLAAAWLLACVGDPGIVPTDAGADGASGDAATPSPCLFGGSKYGGGCKFGP
jgi:hypothetical protein